MTDSILFNTTDSIVADTFSTDSLSILDTIPNIAEPVLPMILRKETMASSTWFGLLLIFILVALAASLSIHRKQYGLLLRNVVNKHGRVMSYDSEHTETWANILLAAIVLLSHSLCIFSVLQIKTDNNLPFWVFLSINLILLLLLCIKWLSVKVIGYIFSMREATKTFITDYFVIFSFWGLLLIPCATGLVYSSISNQYIWIIVVFVLSIFVFLTILIKLLQIFYDGISSLFYIFLYLCILEILPVSIVIKIASALINKV